MKYPTLPVRATSRQFVDVFRGYNHNHRIGDGEFFDMKNMTSDHYPIASPRELRGVYAEGGSYGGLIAKDSLCYVDGSRFVMNEYEVDMGLSEGEKQLVSMGAYVIILPDKMYINTLDLDEWGRIEGEFVSNTNVSFALCKADGSGYSSVSTVEPEITEEMKAGDKEIPLWIDTSSTPHTLKQYSLSQELWVAVATTYVKISAPNIAANFKQYDGVRISGIEIDALADLNADIVVMAKDEEENGWIVVTGIIDEVITQEYETTDDNGNPVYHPITITRSMPEMDFVTEHGNRLWGCRYGLSADGQVVNEIYASKLGDFKNWKCFMGLSTDSYAMSCGTDGPFTGAITHLGYPLFWKENYVHKMYGDYPANFGCQVTACRGVQKDCHKSLAIVGETLFYKARSGVMAYDGSLPSEVSYALGNTVYSHAVGGAHGNKYYISTMGSDGVSNLFIYDKANGLWHKEDDLRTSAFCSCRGEMYAIDVENGRILALLGSGSKETAPVRWMLQTGQLGLSSPDAKYISRLTLRLSMNPGSTVDIYAQYDQSGLWVKLGSLLGTNLRSFSVPVKPRRCDHLQMKLEGTGGMKLYSITKTIEEGSELP